MLGQFIGFEGRVGRGTWWMSQLLGLILLAIALMLFAMADRASKLGQASLPSLSVAFVLVALVFVINLCCTVKRYHDRGKSGFWWFIVFVPFIGGIWQLIELGFCRGDDGDNIYGPPPGSAARLASLDKEIAGMAGGGTMSKLDDNYMAEYAHKIAVQRAEAQQRENASQSSFGGGNSAPVFGKR